ncbi:MAG: galactose-1-phosphate uridylyltransferase [Firmicutes bacterium]|nr:galactose-1-phosphate uridylyltransferase [Bacillota bacterium]
MTEIRKHPVTKKRVIIAVERNGRPSDLIKSEYKSDKEDFVETCPFCPGNEEDTPKEIMRFTKKNDWKVRVVPNKYSALSMKSKCKDDNSELFNKKNGLGFHEVIIEGRKHNSNYFNMNKEDFIYILHMHRERYKDLMMRKGIEYVSIYKNYQKKAGASLEHTHSQMIASPFIPSLIEEELISSKEYFDSKGSCIYCDILKEEIDKKERIVIESENFIVLTPFASMYNYEISIFPKSHQSSFIEMSIKEVRELAGLLEKIFKKMGNLLGEFPFNMFLHNAPLLKKEYDNSYHWHIGITPRFSTQAGFELGSGIYINTISPEDAAKTLRNIKGV